MPWPTGDFGEARVADLNAGELRFLAEWLSVPASASSPAGRPAPQPPNAGEAPVT